MNTHKDEVINLLTRAVVDDEYDDASQADAIYESKVSDWKFLEEVVALHYRHGYFLEIGCGSGKSFKSLPITHAIEPNPIRRERAEKNEKVKVKVVDGCAEAIPYDNSMFDNVLMWGTWCFLRSEKEALIEVNRVLKLNGVFIFDAIIDTSLSIIRVDEPRNLVGRVELFGFKLIELRNVPVSVGQKRIILTFTKVRNFDWKYLCVPQLVGGKINNYVTQRDWYLK